MVESLKMAARAGIETAYKVLQHVLGKDTCKSASKGGAQHGAQIERELAELAHKWNQLAPEIRYSIIALVRAQLPH
jgi:hypothetical protein